ncbi:prephenate dehydrogenase [Salinibacterium sp. SYSU T00001]|uniref:prephenate dehydrogenase n=1 Tax=Homoserinimonas sedimenticola TaxID=2986805 RepID=UPI002235BADE|nr:prephenate dehydrogenase [Salinibacterium sedimenticola]MCW4384167.1 prephenate dehydrogenase [Salinibacterium sedimenticola]
MNERTARTVGPVRVVGAGLLGASVGLGLSEKGVEVIVHDASPTTVSLAVDYGAGRRASDTDAPALIVVAVPPDIVAEVVAQELQAYPDALVTDVASVKGAPYAELSLVGADLSRYIGSHPMAGRERGGAISARADLFIGRPWVITPHAGNPAGQIAVIENLALDLGAIPQTMSAEDHDRAVALVSHAPQAVSTLLARRLVDAEARSLSLAGQGLRDTTRIAASAPELWVQIMGANSRYIIEVLRDLRTDLDVLIHALDDQAAAGARRSLAQILAGGNAGVARIPGKHGQDRRYAQIVVKVEDRPGELARLLSEIGQTGINMEDLRLEHSPGAQIGLAEIAVLPEVEEKLVAELESRGWKIAGAYL